MQNKSGIALSRRAFVLGAGAGLTLAWSKALPAALTQFPSDKAQYATLLHLEKCIGCGACVQACRERNSKRYPQPRKPFPELFPPGTPNEDWSEKQDVEDRLTPYNWLYIDSINIKNGDLAQELHIPRRCMHCLNPPCVAICPFGSAQRNSDTGTVHITPDTCFGGAKCRLACPWHVPQRQSGVGIYLDLLPRYAGNGVMYKCDRCGDSWRRGELPACIEACPQEVQSIGPRHEITAQAQRLLQEHGGFLYGLDDNGGTNTIYLAPVPFAELAQRQRKEPGKPTLAPVPDAMAPVNSLAWLPFCGAVLGLCAGLMRRKSSVIQESEVLKEASARREWDFLRFIWGLLALLLGFTGLMQLPIAQRYGISALPGLDWTADPFKVLIMHYILAAFLLFLSFYAVMRRRKMHSAAPPLSLGGKIRLYLLLPLMLTGILGLLKNLNSVDFGPLFTEIVILSHLAFAIVFGMACLPFSLLGRARRSFARKKASS